jgi:hypothetical protein
MDEKDRIVLPEPSLAAFTYPFAPTQIPDLPAQVFTRLDADLRQTLPDPLFCLAVIFPRALPIPVKP